MLWWILLVLAVAFLEAAVWLMLLACSMRRTEWTGEDADRRAELVAKKFISGLDYSEAQELQDLQERFGQWQDKHYPLPPG